MFAVAHVTKLLQCGTSNNQSNLDRPLVVLVFRRVKQPSCSVFRHLFATAAEAEPLIIDHQFVILPAGP
jgi:hypothetical protein